MCGRYFLGDSPELEQIIKDAKRSSLCTVMEQTLGLTLKTHGEICPTDLVPVIAMSQKGNPKVFPMRWGFHAGNRLVINARSETASEKPMFREEWYRHRCIIPASCYFEWRRNSGNRLAKKGQKYLIQPKGEENTWICGLYRNENGLPHFVILTRVPGAEIAFIHDRMPLILKKDQIREWIDQRSDPAVLSGMPLTEMYFEADHTS